MSLRVLISEKRKNDYTPCQYKPLVVKDKTKFGSKLFDMLCRNGFLTFRQVGHKIVWEDLKKSFNKGDESKEIEFMQTKDGKWILFKLNEEGKNE